MKGSERAAAKGGGKGKMFACPWAHTRSETSKSIIEQRLARTEPGGAQHAAIGIAKERTSKLLPAYGCISNVQR